MTGDRRGIIVISSGEFCPVPRGCDATSEDESSNSTIERRGGIANGSSRHHHMAVKSMSARALSGDGEVTCLAFTRSGSRSRSSIRNRNRDNEHSGSEEGKGREGGACCEREREGEGEGDEVMLAAGTSTGRIAIFDLHSGQVRATPSLKRIATHSHVY